MRNRIFTVSASIIAIIFWFSDALIHYFIYKEPKFEIIPDDFNELWMRIVIIILLILMGIVADYYSKKILIAQKQLEAARIYDSMIYASHHIINNLLNQMELFKLEAKKSKDFNPEVMQYFDLSIDESKDLLRKLSRIENVTDFDILDSIHIYNINKKQK